MVVEAISLGANIIVHSLTKWIGGHGIAIAGAVVDGGNFNWGQNDKFPTIAGPHYAMDSINFFEEFGPAAFTAKFRAEGMYNFGTKSVANKCVSYFARDGNPALADAAAYGKHRKNAGIFVAK
jgi:O-acetylhomoserine/O-acetylserine sulfhydrylase-like pyridoxal-dependent enzyme